MKLHRLTGKLLIDSFGDGHPAASALREPTRGNQTLATDCVYLSSVALKKA